MMTIADLRALVLKWEIGKGSTMGRNPNDSAANYPCPTPYKGKTGWHTVKGITYKTWVGKFGKNQDARWYAMNDKDWYSIFKKVFFDKVGGSQFKSMNVGAVTVDMSFMSGVKPAIKNLQRAVNDVLGRKELDDDGMVGKLTIAAVNSLDPKKLIEAIVIRRKQFLYDLADDNTVKEIKNRTFIKGWINRTNDYLKSYMKGI